MPLDYGAYQIDPMAGFYQGLANIGQALQYRRQMERQERLDLQNKRLGDLQIQESGLNIRESGLKLENLERQKKLEEDLRTRLANLAPGEKPTEVAGEYYQKTGQFEKVAQVINLDDALAKLKAQGDPETYHKHEIAIERMKDLASIIQSYVDKPEVLKGLWPAISANFPEEAKGIDINTLTKTSTGIVVNATNPDGTTNPNIQYMYDNKGNIHIINNTPTPRKKGDRTTIQRGTQVVEQEWNGAKWVDVPGATGPKFAPEKLKPEEEPTYSKLEGKAFQKYLANQPLTSQEKAIVERKLTDPLWEQAVNAVLANPRYNTPEKQVEAIDKTYRTLQEARKKK